MEESLVATLAELEPRSKDLVYDLVRDAGHDVTDWESDRLKGPRVKTNPKYCYEWAFTQPGKPVVLNLWHDDFRVAEGGIVAEGNYRADALNPQAAGAKPMWAKRALRVDAAIRTALIQGLTIRVIVNAGTRRLRNIADLRAASVKRRALDPEPWSITRYVEATGAFQLTRGQAQTIVDQFTAAPPDPTPPDRAAVNGLAYPRDDLVREHARKRSGGRCEYCGARGFTTASGGLYVETHHIAPLSEQGLDVNWNVIALCPTHHREAHYGEDRLALRAEFQRIVVQLEGADPNVSSGGGALRSGMFSPRA